MEAPRILRRGEVCRERLELAPIMTRTPGRATVERFAYLPDTRGLDGRAARGGRETGLFPRQSAESEQPFERRARFGHQAVVAEVEQVGAVERVPVPHEPLV